MKENISAHITYKEATRSNTATRYGLSNDPTEEELAKMKVTAEKLFEPVRIHFDTPIAVNSFFRAPAVNKKVGGSKTSQHMKAEAIDMDDTYGGVKNSEIFWYIADNLDFDQLIIEYPEEGEPAWIHASYVSEEKNRNRILVTQVGDEGTTYSALTKEQAKEYVTVDDKRERII